MKKNNNAAISIFALLSMMFFLIFIMVVYNNVTQKSKTQVETESILYDYYKSTQTADEITKSKLDGKIQVMQNSSLLRSSEQQSILTEENINKYIYSNGKIYKITCDKYKITFDVNGGKNLTYSSKTIVQGQQYGELPTANKDNETLIGWYTQANGGERVTSKTIMGDRDLILYAHYAKTINNYAYTGSEQKYIVPATGVYKIECWGAQGRYRRMG